MGKNGMNNNDGAESRRKRKRRKTILGITAGVLVTAAVGTGLGYVALRMLDASSSVEPTLPQLLSEKDRNAAAVPGNAGIEIQTSDGEKQGISVNSLSRPAGTQEEPSAAGEDGPSAAVPKEPESLPVSPETTDEREHASGEGTAEDPGQLPPAVVSTSAQDPAAPSGPSEGTSAGEPETAAAVQNPEQLSPDELRRREALQKFGNLGVVVNVKNYLNLRTQPTTDSEVCGIIFPYCGLDILEDVGNGWIRISSGGVTGYVAQQFVQTGSKAEELALEHCRYQAEVLVDRLDVMTEPSSSSEVITSIVRGDRFDIYSEPEGWVEIEIAEDRGGYIPASSVSTAYHIEEAVVFGFDASVSQKRRDIINTGLEYYGGKYVFGGKSLTEGIDCSQFTKQIYGMNGVVINDNSWTQALNGVHVDEKDIKPGDLTFYYAAHRTGIGHVAIYIGNGKILHAASERKGITVSDWKYVPIVEIRNVIGD